jgi:inorganic pyrophosphatase
VEFTVVVEIPKGSRNKYEMDHATGRLRLDRALHSAVHYPTDYGFIENTLSDDGDPLDALVLLEEPTFPGCEVDVRPVGAFLMSDEKGGDEKILCVPLADPTWNHIVELDEVPPHLLKQIEHFFQIYKELEEKPTATFGWRDREVAEGIVRKAIDAHESA